LSTSSFSSRPTGGQLRTLPQHPEMKYFSRGEINDLAAKRLIRGMHIERAIDDYENGRRLPLSIVEVVLASALPG
jgi:hypothetical protein